MARRCIVISLTPTNEIAAERSFKRPDLVIDVHSNRGRYVSAALTIVQAWLQAGKPTQNCRPIASFSGWSTLCRQPLIWLGCADPADSLFNNLNEDPDRALLGRLLEAWHDLWGHKPMMVRELIKEMTSYGDKAKDLWEILDDIAGEKETINRHRLGRWLTRQKGQVVNGARLDQVKGKGSADRWAVRRV